MASSTKILLTAAAASLALTQTAAAEQPTTPKGGNPYVAGDMHNHNTCADGSTSARYALDRSVGTGLAPTGGQNFNLDWFTLGNHGGAYTGDCRFSSTGANTGINGDTSKTWNDTMGQTIEGVTVTSLKGTPNGGNMYRWQSIQEIEYPMIVGR